MVKCIFWDRDGVINELVYHDGIYTAPWKAEEFKFTKNIKEAIVKVKNLGYMNFIVTNQPDVLDGNLKLKQLQIMHNMIQKWLGFDEILFEMNRNSMNYKPNNGMVEKLISKYDIDRNQSYLIGDRWKDIVCGYKSNLNTIFIGSKYKSPKEYNNIKPNHIVSSPLEASYLIEEISIYG